jgi:hypothetical protein
MCSVAMCAHTIRPVALDFSDGAIVIDTSSETAAVVPSWALLNNAIVLSADNGAGAAAVHELGDAHAEAAWVIGRCRYRASAGVWMRLVRDKLSAERHFAITSNGTRSLRFARSSRQVATKNGFPGPHRECLEGKGRA